MQGGMTGPPVSTRRRIILGSARFAGVGSCSPEREWIGEPTTRGGPDGSSGVDSRLGVLFRVRLDERRCPRSASDSSF